MSMEPTSSPGRPQSTDKTDQDPGLLRDGGKPSGIRRQAAWIVERVLADPPPEQAGARGLLLEHLAANPGQPEIALAEHLMALRFLTGVPDEVEGTTVVPAPRAPVSRESMSLRIGKVLEGRMLVTAFQPIREISTGDVVGVEAFTRFVSDGGDTAGDWFAAAAAARLGSELEFAALQSALASAQQLPVHLYVALKLSPATCLDPLLPGMLEELMPALDRVVLELTEALTPEQPAALVAALAPLRRRGIRLAVGRVGSYCGSIRHIRQLKPDILKLDRDLVAGIDTGALRHAFGAAMTGFADDLGAGLIAEGIETGDELATLAGLGVTVGQGYYLGRPTIRPRDWAGWNDPVREFRLLTGADGSGPF